MNKKNLFNILSDGTPNLGSALFSYIFVFIISFMAFTFFVKLSFIFAIITSLIISQIFLNFIFVPTKYNIFSELTSLNAFYIFIQVVTPISIYIFAFTVCLLMKKI